ncbi:gibberellin 2beta-dioxygenase [Sarracenia purpurea var. burkii]
MESPEPPFEETYRSLFENYIGASELKHGIDGGSHNVAAIVEERELPVINLRRLKMGEEERKQCKREIAKASQEWGFFQVVNHGVSREVLEKMRCEQVKVFKRPFREKINDESMKFSAGSYRWGTPSATCLSRLSWSEAFHVLLADISGLGGLSTLRQNPALPFVADDIERGTPMYFIWTSLSFGEDWVFILLEANDFRRNELLIAGDRRERRRAQMRTEARGDFSEDQREKAAASSVLVFGRSRVAGANKTKSAERIGFFLGKNPVQ